MNVAIREKKIKPYVPTWKHFCSLLSRRKTGCKAIYLVEPWFLNMKYCMPCKFVWICVCLCLKYNIYVHTSIYAQINIKTYLYICVDMDKILGGLNLQPEEKKVCLCMYIDTCFISILNMKDSDILNKNSY